MLREDIDIQIENVNEAIIPKANSKEVWLNFGEIRA